MIVKSLTLDKIKQLVDINADLTNFKASVEIIPKSGEEYEVAFVNQTILDNAEEFEYSKVKGPFTYGFESVDDMYQNHFLCLKAALPVDVEVKIDTQELPSQVVKTRPEADDVQTAPPEEKFYHKTWFKILIGVVLFCFLIWLYNKYFSSSPPSSESAPATVPVSPRITFNMADFQSTHKEVAEQFVKVETPQLPEISLPEVTLPEISLPEVPSLSESLPESLPEILLPGVPDPVVTVSEAVKSDPVRVRFEDDAGGDFRRKKSEFTTKLLARLHDTE